jgi:hypothetical protein
MAKANSKKSQRQDSANQPGQKGGVDQAKTAVFPVKPSVGKNPNPPKGGGAKGRRST